MKRICKRHDCPHGGLPQPIENFPCTDSWHLHGSYCAVCLPIVRREKRIRYNRRLAAGLVRTKNINERGS